PHTKTVVCLECDVVERSDIVVTDRPSAQAGAISAEGSAFDRHRPAVRYCSILRFAIWSAIVKEGAAMHSQCAGVPHGGTGAAFIAVEHGVVESHLAADIENPTGGRIQPTAVLNCDIG